MPGAILFLDIDGVLNGHEQDAQGYNRIQPGPVVHLNRILAETEARLVISSSWRYLVHSGAMTLEGFSYMLITHGIGVPRPAGRDHLPRRGGRTARGPDHPLARPALARTARGRPMSSSTMMTPA